MAVNKNAQLRYNIIDRCLSNYYRNHTYYSILEEVNKTLEEHGSEGIRLRQLQEDLKSYDYIEYDVKDLNDKYFEDRSPFVAEGFCSKSPKLGWGYLILLTFLVLIPILGQILWLWVLFILGRGMSTSILTGHFNVPVYKPDRRYKEGVRYIGDEAIQVSINTKATSEEKKMHQREFIYAMVGIPVFWLILYIIFR